jgi:nitrite reductase/ring-hydroxylating ferredoxin subunit
MEEIDLTRVLCALAELKEGGARGFSIGAGAWPLRGLATRVRGEVHAFVNRCPHAGHPLNLLPHEFLTPDGALLVCRSHGALFDRETGFCVAGPCSGRSLRPIPVVVAGGFVMLAQNADAAALAEALE